MDRWRGKVAVVTGTSAGIGAEAAKTLVKEGMIVIGLARRKEKMIQEMVGIDGLGKFHAYECDVSKNEDVSKVFENIKDNFKTVNILINNAGILKMLSVEDIANVEDLQRIINVNFMGAVHCSKQAIKLMKENDQEAIIININSTDGHKVSNFPRLGIPIDFNIYPPTKFALTALSEVLSNELRGNLIRVTNLSLGMVNTSIISDENGIPEKVKQMPALDVKDLADAILYVIGIPSHVKITELTIRPLGEIV